ncbi:MAG: hypothetical protein DSY42_01410 [Aquifex sp.]|nr:MAG: hypothetical protein DSY42_01410 [Aquifex sp.]
MGEMSIKERIEIVLEIYKDISRQIQFADTKAGLILAWHGASLGFITKILFDALKSNKDKLPLEYILVLLFILILIFAGISIYYALNTVYPRLRDTDCVNECMFWAYHISCEDFQRDLERFKQNMKDLNRILDCLSRSVVSVSGILKNKYSKLQSSVRWLIISLFLEIVFLIVLFIGYFYFG